MIRQKNILLDTCRAKCDELYRRNGKINNYIATHSIHVPYSLVVSILFALSNSGCQLAAVPVATAMQLANSADQHTTRKQAKIIWDSERENIRDLQARGDPMGDYLYAVGNSQGWIQDVSDSVAILGLFKKAADEGSSDAQIVLGLYYFTGAIPMQGSKVRLPEEMRNRELGEQLIRTGIKTRCTYAEPVPGNDRVYLRYVSAAQWLRYIYRDGRYTPDSAGRFHTVIPRNPQLEKEWRDLDAQCEASGATSK